MHEAPTHEALATQERRCSDGLAQLLCVETSSARLTARDKSAYIGHASKFVTDHQVWGPNLAVI